MYRASNFESAVAKADRLVRCRAALPVCVVLIRQRCPPPVACFSTCPHGWWPGVGDPQLSDQLVISSTYWCPLPQLQVNLFGAGHTSVLYTNPLNQKHIRLFERTIKTVRRGACLSSC